jgi:secondary thiamine-phosphate synthase enzyme
MKKISLSTTRRNQFIDITDSVNKEISRQKVNKGFCFLFCPHTTAALTINEGADPVVKTDIINWLNQYIPVGADYQHLEGNADAHIKSSLLGCDLKLIIDNNRVVLGTWQSIYFCEFDGPRQRTFFLSFLTKK